MMLSAYIWIDGKSFNVPEFQKLLPEGMRGTVGIRKRMVDGSAVRDANYWKSSVITATETLSDSILEGFLTKYGDYLTKARQLNATRIVLEIVSEYSDSQEAQGVFISGGLIKILANVDASVDIDVVRQL